MVDRLRSISRAPIPAGATLTDAHALARIVIEVRHVDVAAIAVLHVVTDDAALTDTLVDHAAARFGRSVITVVATCGAVADRPTNEGTGHGRSLSTVSLADRIAQCATDDRADHGAGSIVAARIAMLDDLGVMAFLARTPDFYLVVNRIDTQHIGPGDAHVVPALVAVAALLRMRHARCSECSKRNSG